MTKDIERWWRLKDYVELLDFLVEKSKRAEQPLNLQEMIRQFAQIAVVSTHNQFTLISRINRFRLIIHEMPHFDTEMKVRLMYALSGWVDSDFEQELKIDGEIVLDGDRNIEYYKKGDLELRRKVKSEPPVVMVNSGRRNNRRRTRRNRPAQIPEDSDETDDDEDVVKKKNAGPSNDDAKGKKEVKEEARQPPSSSSGNHSNAPPSNQHRKRASSEKKEEVEEKKPKMELKTEDPIIKLEPFKGPLKDDISRGNIIKNADDCVKRTPDPTEIFVAPKYEEKLIKLDPINSEIKEEETKVKSDIDKKPTLKCEEVIMEIGLDDVKIDMKINSKRDEGNLAVLEKSSEVVMRDDEDTKPIQQDSLAPTEQMVIPKYEEMLLDVKKEEMELNILDDQIDKKVQLKQEEGNIEEKQAGDVMEVLDDSMKMNSSNSQLKNGPIQQDSTSSEDVEKDHTPLALILESSHELVDTLMIPGLSDIQEKIQKKIEESKKAPKVRMVSVKKLHLLLQLILLEMTENAESTESSESFRLESFLTALRLAVVRMKCPSLIEFQEKLKGMVGELRVQNKFVPVTSIRNAIQTLIDKAVIS